MRQSYIFKDWGKLNPHPYADMTHSQPKDMNCKTTPTSYPAHFTEGSFDATENSWMPEYTSVDEEPRAQLLVAARDVQKISQKSPRATPQYLPRQVRNLQNKNKRLQKNLNKERAASQELASKLNYCKYNGQRQMRLATPEEGSHAHENVWVGLEDTEHESKVLQEGPVALREELEAQKEALSQLQGAVKTLETTREELAASQKEVRTYEAELLCTRDNEQDLQDTRQELAASQQELRACKDDLFRLQPVTQITDADILRGFESLCQRISDWVESEMSLFEDSHPNTKPGHMFSALGNPELKPFLQKYSEVGEYLIMNMIHRHLQESMFDKDIILFGLPESFGRLLKGAERSMAMLEPRRERSTIDTWRSETLTALSAYGNFRDHQRQQLVKTSKHVFDNLSLVFPIIRLQHQSLERFHHRIMLPAAELASKAQAAASTYEFAMPKDALPKFNPIRICHLASSRMVEVSTGKTLKPNSNVVPDNDGLIGDIVLPLEPSLHRINGDQRSTSLRQASYLVKLDKPLLKVNKA